MESTILTFLRRFALRVVNLCRPWRVEPDLDRELTSHLQLLEDDFRRRGLNPDAARLAARRAFGSVGHARELHREARSFAVVDDVRRDIRHAIRTLRRTPTFATIAVLTLALGIGASSAIFTLMDGLLLQSLPVTHPSELVLLGNATGSGTSIGQAGSFVLYSYDLYRHLQSADVFDGLCAVESTKKHLGVRPRDGNTADPSWTRLVSGNYFDVLGVKPALGRTFQPEDDQASAAPVAVVSHRFWKERLHSDPSVVGSTAFVGHVPVTIVGVTPPEFYGENLEADPADLWLSLSIDRLLDPSRLIDIPDIHWLYLIGRLHPAISKAQAQTRLTTALQAWLRVREGAAIVPDREREIARSVVELTSAAAGIAETQRTYAPMLQILLAMSGVVLLIACANVANLLFARGAARTREQSIRLALGASRGRLIRQSLTESATLAIAGGLVGLALAWTGATVLLLLAFSGAEHLPLATSPNVRVLGFTFTVACGSAILSGLLPALRTPANLFPAMKIVSPPADTNNSKRFRAGNALIVGQVALSLIVLAVAGALTRSLTNLARQRFGFTPEHVLIVDVDPASAGYSLPRLASLYRELQSRLNAIPGVKNAAFSYYSPFNHCCWGFTIAIQRYTPKPDENVSARLNRVSAGYFDALGIRLLSGRRFDDRDTTSAGRVAIVNEEFVRRYFSGTSALGGRFGIGVEDVRQADLEIVGVVENAKHDNPREQVRPMAFLPLLQPSPDDASGGAEDSTHFIRAIEVRAVGDPSSIAGAVRQTLTSIDPNFSPLGISTLVDHVDRSLARESAVADLTTWFAVVALALTCIGLYGLTAYAVQRRTAEIGIRMALGADRRRVLAMVIREVFGQAAAGIGIGVPAALVATRLLQSMLYGVRPGDPTQAIVAALVLFAAMMLAGYAPARRASRIEPMVALRQE